MPQTLDELLRSADATHATPHATGDLSPLVRCRHRRRTLARRAIATTALLLSISLVTYKATAPSSPLPPTEARVTASVETGSLTDLNTLAEISERTADLFAAARPRVRPNTSVTINPEPDYQFQRDRAALILVYEADRHVQENRPAAALASYRRAIELFPQTHWAEVARQRVKQMQS